MPLRRSLVPPSCGKTVLDHLVGEAELGGISRLEHLIQRLNPCDLSAVIPAASSVTCAS